MSNLYFVNASRLSIALVNGPDRQRELIGPFDDWLAASRYAVAWRNLWKAEAAEAHVEVPLTPCADVLEWYDDKLERDAAAPDARTMCDDCGDAFEEIVGCPDGAEICQSCFDAGGH